MKCYFIRHGKTSGNLLKRYIGRTDEELCKEGIDEVKSRTYPEADLVIHSGMKRTIQTAEIIYDKQKVKLVQEELLRECDFGIFEGKNYQELSNCREYQKWIDSQGKLPFPQGESREEFIKRCIKGFSKCIEAYKEYDTICFCVHGGTIMAILSTFASDSAVQSGEGTGKEYYDYHCENGECLSYELYFNPNTKWGFTLKKQ